MDQRDRLDDQPPSAKLVHTVLRREGPLTQGAIADVSRLCPRTVRHATARLEAADLVTVSPYPADRRRSLYAVPEGTGDAD